MMTAHATARAQQRGIPRIIVDLLLQFGASEQDGHGAEIVYFDHNARKQVERYSGGLIRKLSEQLDAYAVVANGQIVTVGARYKRIHNA